MSSVQSITALSEGSPPSEAPQSPPLVTALVVTFNHRRYIAAALDSVLGQRTTFPVEIIVSEDASTDGTRDIVLDYARRHQP